MENYFIQCYRAGYFNAFENGCASFNLTRADWLIFPELRGHLTVLVYGNGSGLIVEVR
jgi:hypothetical protein